VLLLRKLAGFSKDEVKAVFRSRMKEPFDLQGLLAGTRSVASGSPTWWERGRFLTLGLAGFSFIYARRCARPEAGLPRWVSSRASSTRSPIAGG
jgi:hypothetical protein